MAFVFEDEIGAKPQAQGHYVFDDIPEEHPLSGVTAEARLKAMNPTYRTDMPKWAGMSPNLYAGVRTARDIISPTVEAIGFVGGGIAGTAAGGPAGSVAGAGLGYAGAKRLTKAADVALGFKQPETISESFKQTGKDVLEGAAMEAGGQVISKGAGLAAEGAKRLIPKRVPEKLYASATKMSTTLDPKERAARVATGLREGITPNDKGLLKLEELKRNVFKQVDDVIKEGAGEGKTISTEAVVKRLEDVKAKFSESATPTDYLDAIDKIAQDFKTHGEYIPIDKAQRIKQNIYQILKNSAYGELKGPAKESHKAIARGIKEELEAIYPELQGLNKKASEYIKLQDSLERAVGRIQNRDVISLGDEVMTAAGATLGGPLGAGAVVTKKILGLPSVKARLAIALYNARQIGKVAVPSYNPSSLLPPAIGNLGGRSKTPPMPGGGSSTIDPLFSPKTEAILNSNLTEIDKERFLIKRFEQQAKRIVRPIKEEQEIIKNVRVPKRTSINFEKDSLLDFIRKSGGLSTEREYLKTELKDRYSIKEGYNLINNRTGHTLDEMGELAHEAGYFQERPSATEVLDAMDMDLTYKQAGKNGRVWSMQKQNWDDNDFPF